MLEEGAGLDADALLDSRGFVDALRALDPSGASFARDLESVIAEYADDPRFAAGGRAAPVRSGGDFSGGSGGRDAPQTVDDFRRRRRARRGGSEQ